MVSLFTDRSLSYQMTIRARFGSTVCALVTNGLGIAIIDAFTMAGDNWPGIASIAIEEPTEFETYVAFRKDIPLSTYCTHFVSVLRAAMTEVSTRTGAEVPPAAGRPARK